MSNNKPIDLEQVLERLVSYWGDMITLTVLAHEVRNDAFGMLAEIEALRPERDGARVARDYWKDLSEILDTNLSVAVRERDVARRERDEMRAAEAAAQVPRSYWISVDERLPGDARLVFARSRHKKYGLANYYTSFSRWEWQHERVSAHTKAVTHWADLSLR